MFAVRRSTGQETEPRSASRLSARHRTGRKPAARRWLRLELLEDRRLLAEFMVNSTGDEPDFSLDDHIATIGVPDPDHPGKFKAADPPITTLRAAIQQANFEPGRDTIQFEVPQISLSSPYLFPEITDEIVIDGGNRSVQLSGMNLRVVSANSEVRELVVDRLFLEGDNCTVEDSYVGVDKAGAAAVTGGLSVSSSNNTIRRNIIGTSGTGFALVISQGAGNRVVGNLIGVAAGGHAALTGLERSYGGIQLYGANDNVIGGTSADDRNVISGFSSGIGGTGIRINGSYTTAPARNWILGNYIGTDATGHTAIPNYLGVWVLNTELNPDGTDSNMIGGEASGAGNLISGNLYPGIVVQSSHKTVIQGNVVGRAADGQALGNGDDGIRVIQNSLKTTIGGSTEGAGNTIAFNGRAGVALQSNGAQTPTQTRILGNSIFANAGLGIDLERDGLTLNDVPPAPDPPDTDIGTNLQQNFPVVTLTGDGSVLQVGLESTPGKPFAIEVFSNDPGKSDPSGYGEGETFLGRFTMVTNSDGRASDTAPFAVPTDKKITATATDAEGNTSEFSHFAEYAGFVVNSTDNAPDSNPGDGRCSTGKTLGDGRPECTLRAAIMQANQDAKKDTIIFQIPANDPQFSDGVYVIRPAEGPGVPASDAPLVITAPVVIDATTQPGFEQTPIVELDGSAAPDGADGLKITAGGTTVMGLVINRFPGDGIELNGGADNQISKNYIGTNASGDEAQPNSGHGVSIVASQRNMIGGSDADDGNVLSGNTLSGVRIFAPASQGAADNKVQGNMIGTGPNGRRPDSGADLGNQEHGIHVVDAASNTLGGSVAGTDPMPGRAPGNVISDNTLNGVFVEGSRATQNTITGNLIGLDATGTVALGNKSNGVAVAAGASHNWIGGTDVGARNVISANEEDGVSLSAANAGENVTDNKIRGNYIGTDIFGARPADGPDLGNGGNGVFLQDVAGNTVGGIVTRDVAADGPDLGTPPGNVISDNARCGVQITGARAQGNSVQGNLLGTDAAGQADLGNSEDGVAIEGGDGNKIGGPALGEGNVISANDHTGVFINATRQALVQGNLIGTQIDGKTGLGNMWHGVWSLDSDDNTIGGDSGAHPGNVIAVNGADLGVKGHGIVVDGGQKNRIQRNSLFANSGRGIDLEDDSFTLNDFGWQTNAGDPDAGANGLQDYPVVTGVTFAGADKTITWTLNTAPGTYTIDFYSNTAYDDSGFGEGEKWLRALVVNTDAQGNSTFTETFPAAEPFISTTATDANGNTSEFSPVDTDGDAAADAWETRGIDVNEDGVIDFALASNPNHKDIFVEADAMEGLAPFPGLLDRVVAAFDDAPADLVKNPDGRKGITLHATLNEVTLPVQDFPNDFTEFNPLKDAHFMTEDERNDANQANIRAAKRLVYHYMIFAKSHGTTTSGGQGECAGNDFYVTLGLWGFPGGTADQQAGMFMHELGHNLGLWDGGGEQVFYKPNYHSVMNYTWTTKKSGMVGWTLDYSRQKFDDLDERNRLNETVGIGGHAGHTVQVGPPPVRLVDESGPVDWSRGDDDGDGTADNDTGVSADVNRMFRDSNGDGRNDALDTVLENLQGYEDWSHLQYYFLETVGGTWNGVNAAAPDTEYSYDIERKFEDIAVPKDLSLLIADAPDPATVGRPLVYTLTVTNHHANEATDVTIRDPLPAGVTYVSAVSSQGSCAEEGGVVTCSLGVLAGLGQATATVTVLPQAVGPIVNTATLLANADDPQPDNNTAAAATQVDEPEGWQNPLNRFEVDGNTRVEPLDVLVLINYINRHPGETALPAPPAAPPPYYDVNADQSLTPQDVLLVINHINSHATGSEGEALSGATNGTARLSWGTQDAGSGVSEPLPNLEFASFAGQAFAAFPPRRVGRPVGESPWSAATAASNAPDSRRTAVIPDAARGAGSFSGALGRPNRIAAWAADRKERNASLSALAALEDVLPDLAADIGPAWRGRREIRGSASPWQSPSAQAVHNFFAAHSIPGP